MQAKIRWDAHSCVPLKSAYALERLERHRRSGFDFVSINVGMDMSPVADIVRVIASFRKQILEHPGLLLAEYFDDVERAASSGRLAVAFDIEGAMPLLSQPAMIGLYQQLGVRQMLFAYNRRNEAAGGCYDPGAGLTELGQLLVRECEKSGVVVDCSHLNERTALQIMDAATNPIVFSHSNARRFNTDLRNITDQAIDRCAAVGGVVGIAGISRLLADKKADLERFAEQVDYIAQRVGAAHVGVGLDYVYDVDQDELPAGTDPAYWFPAEHGYGEDYYKSSVFLPPEELLALNDRLSRMGYSPDDLAAINGGNFARVAKRCWKPRPTQHDEAAAVYDH